MDRFAVIYLAGRLFAQVADFFVHWYINGFWIWGRGLINFLERLDKYFAFRITLRHFGEPLFQDRTILGYIMGFTMRSGLLIIGGAIYFFTFLAAVILYVAWGALLPFVVFKIITG